ncbi:MAG: hypothetical protein RLZZ481_2107 [Pseudomonadota bacterium]|jgi:hypothetical protein
MKTAAVMLTILALSGVMYWVLDWLEKWADED